MEIGLRGRAAAVAAASKGLGRAVALAFAREGADVAICARGEDQLNATAEELRAFGVRVHAVTTDLAARGAAAAFVDGAAGAFGRLDILVANSGGPPGGDPDSFGEDDYRSAVELNLMSSVGMCGAAIPHMRRGGWGRIVIISSITVKQPVDGLILSSTVRSGVAGYAKALSDAVAPDGITVNSVCPGVILTDRIRELAAERSEKRGVAPEVMLKAYEPDIPMKRLGTPEELAAVVAFLASEPASYVTGTVISVDGGMARPII